MRWQRKAAIMRVCAVLPYGDRLYKAGQKRFGRLKVNPMARLPMQAEMARWLQERCVPQEGVPDVGDGWDESGCRAVVRSIRGTVMVGPKSVEGVCGAGRVIRGYMRDRWGEV